MNRSHIVSQISSVLREIVPDGVSLLYGSEARGDSRKDSDIDILVVLPDGNERGSFAARKIEISERLYDIELSTGVQISPLVVLKSKWERLKTPFTINVTNDAVVI